MYIYVDIVLLMRIVEFLLAVCLVVYGLIGVKETKKESDETNAIKDKKRKEAYERIMKNKES